MVFAPQWPIWTPCMTVAPDGLEHRATVTRRLSTIAGFYKYAVEEELLDRSPAAHVRRPRVDYESNAVALDRNELGGLLVAAGLGSASGHALNGRLGFSPREHAPRVAIPCMRSGTRYRDRSPLAGVCCPAGGGRSAGSGASTAIRHPVLRRSRTARRSDVRSRTRPVLVFMTRMYPETGGAASALLQHCFSSV
jgi:hypothetical protein